MAHIRVSVIGGGLAGCTLANGLMKHSHITFDIFESKPAFTEIGWGVGLSSNATRALGLIGPHMTGMLADAEAVQESGNTWILSVGPQKGSIIQELKPGATRVHRARWLDQLLKPVPKERLHAGKKLISIESDSEHGPYTLTFQDGTKHAADIVIGADGIHSAIRSFVLGIDHPAAKPEFAGFHNARFALPVERGLELFGNGTFDPSSATQFTLVGGNTMFLYSLMDDKKVCNIGVAWKATAEDYPGGAWRKPMTREYLEEQLREWNPEMAAIIVDSLLDSQVDLFAQYKSAATPTYTRGRVLVIGDAAHSTTPWQGSGAGMSVEDAAVLEALFGHVKTLDAVEKAFRLFDQVRRPRCERIIQTSSQVGVVALCGSTDPAHFRSSLTGLWDHIANIDLASDIEGVVMALSGENN